MRALLFLVLMTAALYSTLTVGIASAQGLTRTINGPTAVVQTAGATSASANVFTIAAPNGGQTRGGCSIFNVGTAPILLYFKTPNGPPATLGAAVPIPAGTEYVCHGGEQDELDVASATVSVPYVLMLR